MRAHSSGRMAAIIGSVAAVEPLQGVWPGFMGSAPVKRGRQSLAQRSVRQIFPVGRIMGLESIGRLRPTRLGLAASHLSRRR
jgi:hypothetical protein